MLKTAVAAIALMASVQAGFGSEIDADKSFAVIGFMRSYGCSLNAQQVQLFLPHMKVTEAEYEAIQADLVSRGFATGDHTVVDSGVVLTPAFCGINASGDPGATLIEAMRFNDCRLTQQDPPVILAPIGFMPDTLRPLVQELMASGTLLADGADLVLSTQACARQ